MIIFRKMGNFWSRPGHDNLRQGGMTDSASPPGHGDEKKIGTWNEGRENNAEVLLNAHISMSVSNGGGGNGQSRVMGGNQG